MKNSRSQRFFISFNSKDDRKAQWIAWTLKSAGHEVAVHDWELPAGGDIPTWMNERLAWAERLIAVISPDYVNAVYSVSEWTSKVWGDPSGKRGAVIPVIVRATPQLPPLLEKLSRIDLIGKDEAEATELLLKRLDLPTVPTIKPTFESSPYDELNQGPPVRPPYAAPEASELADGPLGVILRSSAAAARATGEFASQLEFIDNLQRVETYKEHEALKSVIRDLMDIELEQAPLPWLLRLYAGASDPKNWAQVTSVVAKNSPIVDRLMSLLNDFDGSLIYRDVETYRALRQMTHSRASLYSKLESLERPITADDKALLIAIADNFDELIAQIKTVQSRLGRYLTGGTN